MVDRIPQSKRNPLSILLINHLWFADELRALGHAVVSATWAHDGCDLRFERLTPISELLARMPEGFVPDRIIYFDDSYSVSVLGLEHQQIPLVFYSIDAHHHAGWHSQFAALFDHVLIAQSDYLERFAERQIKRDWLQWLPLWAPRAMQPGAQRDIDVCFRGTMDPGLHPKRVEFFSRLAEHVPVDAASGDYTAVYPFAKIVINQNVGNDVNFRVFEAMMAGALLITPLTGNGLLELFEDGADLLTYESGNVEQAAELISKYLADDDARKAIAERGRDKVLAFHTPAVRAQRISDLLCAMRVRTKPMKFFGAAATYLHATTAYRIVDETQAEMVSAARKRLLDSARENLMLSAEQAESLDETFRAHVLLCKCGLEAMDLREELLDFSAAISKAYPSDTLLALSYIEDLLAAGDGETAKQIASSISNVPDELMLGVPPLLKAAKDRVKTA